METKYHGYDQAMKRTYHDTLLEISGLNIPWSEDSPTANSSHTRQVDKTIVCWSSLGPGPCLWMPLLDDFCRHPCPERFGTAHIAPSPKPRASLGRDHILG